MSGIPYCHDRADETPDKEEYEKASDNAAAWLALAKGEQP